MPQPLLPPSPAPAPPHCLPRFPDGSILMQNGELLFADGSSINIRSGVTHSRRDSYTLGYVVSVCAARQGCFVGAMFGSSDVQAMQTSF